MGIDLLTDEFTQRDWELPAFESDVRFAIVGLGGFARGSVLPALETAQNCQATVLVSGDQEKATQVGSSVGADHALTYEEFNDGVATASYDAVYVATPNAKHLPFIESAAAHGKHVIVEKPLEASIERARQAVETCENAGVLLMVGYRMQIDPMMRGVRRLLQDGYIGSIVHLRGSFSYPLDDPDHWRVNPDYSGGGALMDVGIYPVNTARFLTGEEPVVVDGVTKRAIGSNGIDEHVSAQLSFDTETTAICTASHGAYRENQLTIVGSDGVIAIDPAFDVTVPRELEIRRDGEQARFTGLSTNEIVEEFEYFAGCIESGITPEPSGEDGLRDMKVIQAIYQAADRGMRVTL